ncbi:MAG TPA: hypothetical protein VGO07_03555 [Candidatus Saccharimonadales bacterium]|jgi:hypothetical protein|nr:hypothetical protein [Candidatus Saccharimonadales bacterium]
MTTLEEPLLRQTQAPHFLGNSELKALRGVIGVIDRGSLDSIPVTSRGERQQVGLYSSGMGPGTWSRIRRFGPIHPGPNDPRTTAVVSIWNGTPSPYRRRDPELPEHDQSEALRNAEDTGIEIEIIQDGTTRHAILDIETGEATYRELDAASGEIIGFGTEAEAYGLASEAFAEYFALPLAVGAIATESTI